MEYNIMHIRQTLLIKLIYVVSFHLKLIDQSDFYSWLAPSHLGYL